MNRKEKALDRLLDPRGSTDRNWKTFAEITEALAAIGWRLDDGGTTHRSTWSHPDSTLILEASCQKEGIKPGYIKRMRKALIDLADSDNCSENHLPELYSYFNESGDPK